MKQKTFSKKLILNKTTIATLSATELKEVNGGHPQAPSLDGCFLSYGCVYTVGCTGLGCADSVAGNNCIYTNYGDMIGCPATMTLCGQLYCP